MFSIDGRALAVVTALAVVLLISVGAAPPSSVSVTPRAKPALTGNKVSNVLPGVQTRLLPSKMVSNNPGVAWTGGGNDLETWCAELLPRLDVVPQRQNVGACVAWARAEGTYLTINNPLNTTQEMPGSSCYNTVCVRVYQSREDGFNATVTTFGYTGHGYEAILAGLQANDGDATVQAIEVSDWGTGGLAAQVWGEIKGSYR